VREPWQHLKQELLIDFQSTQKPKLKPKTQVGLGLLTGLGHKLYLHSNLEPFPGLFFMCSAPNTDTDTNTDTIPYHATRQRLLHFPCSCSCALALWSASLSNLSCLLSGSGFFLQTDPHPHIYEY